MTADTVLNVPAPPIVVEIDNGAAWWIFTDKAAAIQHIREARAEGHRAAFAHPVADYRARLAP